MKTKIFLLLCLLNCALLTLGEDTNKKNYYSTSSGNIYNPYYVFDVWETCFTQKFLCKKVLTRLFVSNDNSKSDTSNGNYYSKNTIGPENLVEKIFFGRSHEQIISEMTKFSTMFKKFVEINDRFVDQYLKYTYLDTSDNQIVNISSPMNIWKQVFDEISYSYIYENNDSDSIISKMDVFTKENDQIQCYHKNTIDEMTMLINKLQIYLTVETITNMAYSLPQTIYTETKNDLSSETKKRQTGTTQQTVEIKSCSGNTYAAFDPVTNSYYCACYSDKNCFVDISSVMENESIHPLLIVSVVTFVFLLFILIYTDLTTMTIS